MKRILYTLLLLIPTTFVYSQENEKLLEKLQKMDSIKISCLKQNDAEFCEKYLDEITLNIFKNIYSNNRSKLKVNEIYNMELEILESRYNEFIRDYNELYKLENYNVNLQKALLKNFSTKYNNEKKFKESFLDKNELTKYINKMDRALIIGIVAKQMNVIVKNAQKEEDESYEKLKSINIYRDKNLKRLNILLKDYELMSENDKNLLWKTFKD